MGLFAENTNSGHLYVALPTPIIAHKHGRRPLPVNVRIVTTCARLLLPAGRFLSTRAQSQDTGAAGKFLLKGARMWPSSLKERAQILTNWSFCFSRVATTYTNVWWLNQSMKKVYIDG